MVPRAFKDRGAACARVTGVRDSPLTIASNQIVKPSRSVDKSIPLSFSVCVCACGPSSLSPAEKVQAHLASTSSKEIKYSPIEWE